MSETPQPPSDQPAAAPPAPDPAPPPADPAPATGSAGAPPGADKAKEAYSQVMGDQNLKIGAAGFLIAFIGLFLSWVSVSAGPFTASASGWDLDRGVFLFILTLVVAGALYMRQSLIAMAVGAVATIWTFLGAFHYNFGDTSFGFWISVIGAAVMTFAAYGQFSKPR